MNTTKLIDASQIEKKLLKLKDLLNTFEYSNEKWALYDAQSLLNSLIKEVK